MKVTYTIFDDWLCFFRIGGSPAGSAIYKHGFWSYVGISGMEYRSRRLDGIFTSAVLHGDFPALPVSQ